MPLLNSVPLEMGCPFVDMVLYGVTVKLLVRRKYVVCQYCELSKDRYNKSEEIIICELCGCGAICMERK